MYKCAQFMALEINFPASRSAYTAWNVKMWLFSFSYVIFDNKDRTVTWLAFLLVTHKEE